MPLKVGIISANWGAMAHLPAWRALDGVEVTAMCTSREESARAATEKYGIERPFWDFEAMCADPDLDIIDCGTRPTLRHRMVQAAFEGGKHVYNGIPFAANLSDARDMRAAWKASGKQGIVDALAQWVPAHRLMREMIDDGSLGTPFGGVCRFNMSFFNPPEKNFGYNWFSEGGHGVSAVRNMGSHALHLLVHLLGPIAEVVADDRLALKQADFPDGGGLTFENNDFVNALLRFENGMILQYQISWSGPLGEGWQLDLWGSKGHMIATDPSFPTPQGTKLRAGQSGGSLEEIAIPDRLKSAEGIGIDWTFPMPPSFPMALAMRSMVDSIEGRGAKPAPDFAQAYEVERVQEAIRISSNERCWVSLSDIP